MPPAAGETTEDLAGVGLAARELPAGIVDHRIAVFVGLGDAGFTEVLLGDDVDGNLGPGVGDLDIIELKDGGTVGIAYFRGSFDEIETTVW